jgi:hypothetical protein
MKVGKPPHEQLVAFASKSPQLPPLDTKVRLQRTAQTWPKPKAEGKLVRSNAKIKDTKAAEARAVKTTERARKEEVRMEKCTEEKPKDKDKVDLCLSALIYFAEVLTITALLQPLAQTKVQLTRTLLSESDPALSKQQTPN